MIDWPLLFAGSAAVVFLCQNQSLLKQLQETLVTLNEQHQLTKREMATMRIMHTQKVHELEDELARKNDEKVSFISQVSAQQRTVWNSL